MKQTFNEEQSFLKSWVGLILIAAFLFPIYGIYQELETTQGLNEVAKSNVGSILTILFFIGALVSLLMLKLKTDINEYQIKIKFFPFTNKTIPWSEIQNVTVLNYGFVGGWGVRLWTKYGTVYNISGNKGLYIELKNGDSFLVGTQKEQELKLLINYYSKRKLSNEIEK